MFHNHQKKWATAYVIVLVVLIPLTLIGMIVAMTMPALMSNTYDAQNRTASIKAVVNAQEATMMMEASEEKCELTSNGLAKCFEKRLNIDSANSYDNVLALRDGSVWTFTGNGSCLAKDDCSISVSGKFLTKDVIIPLYVKKGNFVKIREEDVQKYLK